LACGDPPEDSPPGVIRGSRVFECRTGIFRNNSGCCRICRVEDSCCSCSVGRNAGGGLEGCRALVGGIGTGGVGKSFDDRRRARRSSSSKTVSCVRMLALLARFAMPTDLRKLLGLCCRSSALRGGCGGLTFTDFPGNSALMARPIWSDGTDG